MNLQPLDIGIVVGYLVLTLLIGFLVSNRASKNLDSYFLGGRRIPWYILGISNASGMFDITGTMWFVSILFIYGLKGAWLPWMWPIWNQIFLMVFLASWLRRSNAMTGAEWLKTRFGEERGGRLSHIIVVIFAIISVIGFIAYTFSGIGKFATSFFPWDLTMEIGSRIISSENMYALLIIGFTTLYTIKGGMYSVVATEIMQYLVMIISCILVGVIAINLVTPEQLNAVIPAGWKDLFFGWKLNLDWSNLIPSVKSKISADGYEYFSILFMIMVFKGILTSIAGPVPSYDLQRILSTKSPRDAARMTGFTSLVLFFPRFLMVAGITVLVLVYFSPKLNSMGSAIDFEMILPYAVSNFIPTGLLGLLLVGLIAAFMSTFSAYVNAGPAYIVNDIYKKFINPDASSQKYIHLSYWVSFILVIIGVIFGMFISSIDSATKWIVSSLYGGYTAANVLKWIWWRFNGYGYFWGMLTGLAASLFIPLFFPEASALNTFPIILLISSVGSIAGSLLTEPDNEEVLKKFYSSVRPWGFWEPIYRKVKAENPLFKKNGDFGRDMMNSVVGIAWQMSMLVMPIYLVIREYMSLSVAFAVFMVTTIFLKYYWYDRLEDW
ncbi:MAG: sodium:solute symporter family protein [Mariniphaga sp.]